MLFYGKMQLAHRAMKLAAFMLLAVGANALKASKGTIKLDHQKHAFGSEPIPLDIVNRNLDISFRLLEDDGARISRPGPRQVSVILAAESLGDSETYYYPEYSDDKDQYKLRIAADDISRFYKVQPSITVKLLVGDTDRSRNLLETIGHLAPTSKMVEDTKVEMPRRFVSQPEIHHIFQSDTKQAPKTLAYLFVIGAIAVFLGFLWFLVLDQSVNVANLGSVGITSFIFFGTLVGFECVFYSYYLGTSIFTTLTRCAILGTLSVYSGSKTLRSLYVLRSEGKR